MRLRCLISFFTCLALSSMATGESALCANGQITAHSKDPVHLSTACSGADHALKTLQKCNVRLKRPVEVFLRDSLPPNCLGLFHCDNDSIELLTPAAMAEFQKLKPLFAHLSPQQYFTSILTHELAHAAYEEVPCPFDHCVGTSEYLAHTMQLMSLRPAELAQLETQLDMDTPVSHDEVSAMIYFFAPDMFLRKSWAHLNQRPDSCAYVEAIMRGRVYFDRFHP